MTTRDRSQLPVEQLAQLLLERAREDAALPRRAPANDEGTHRGIGGDTAAGLGALPELHREVETLRFEPRPARPLVPAAAVASNEDLEELVSIALTCAQDAEDISREANVASRIARRGMLIAVGVAALGTVIAIAGTVSVRFYQADTSQMAKIASQVQALGELQRHIDDQLAELHAAGPVQQASASPAAPVQRGGGAPGASPQQASARPVASVQQVSATPVTSVQQASAAPVASVQEASARPVTSVQQGSGAPVASMQQGSGASASLPPIRTVAVRELPAEAATPQSTSAAGDRPAGAATSAPAYAAMASAAAAYPPAPPAASDAPYHATNATWARYHQRPRRYRTVVLPQPVGFVIGTLRRDVRALFR